MIYLRPIFLHATTLVFAILVVVRCQILPVSCAHAAPPDDTPVPNEATLLLESLRLYHHHVPNPLRAFFNQQIRPHLECRHVSEFIIGSNEIRVFIQNHRRYFENLFHRLHPDASQEGYGPFVEQFIAPPNVEIGTFFFKERFGKNEPFPIIMFDAAFDGEGITTVEDLIAALQNYEIPRLAQMRHGIDFGAFRLDRDRFLRQHLITVKLALECWATDHILQESDRAHIQISPGFKNELINNYIRYYRMLKRLAEGRYYVIDTAGNPFFIETPLDLELARAQLARMHFALSPDPDSVHFTLVPNPKPVIK